MKRLFSTPSCVLVVLFVVACNGDGDVCSRSASASKWCGGDPTSSDHAVCDPRVAAACTANEQRSYEAFLSCAEERCREHSPDRQVSSHCDALLATVSAACYAAGIVGGSAYRYCGSDHPDACLTMYGYACDTTDSADQCVAP